MKVYVFSTFLFFSLKGISGFYTPRIIEEVEHNRTVNIHGGEGKNVPMDRVCEFLNAEFKGNFKLLN